MKYKNKNKQIKNDTNIDNLFRADVSFFYF